MKSNFANYSDKFFVATILWLFVVYALGYFMTVMYLKIICATSITLIILKMLNRNKPTVDYSIINEFAYMSIDEQNSIIAQKISGRYKVKIVDGVILVGNAMLILKLNLEKTTLDDVINAKTIAKKLYVKKIIFLSPFGKTAGAEEAIKRIDISTIVFDDKKTYEFLKAFDALPPKEDKKTKNSKLNSFFINALDKSKAKSYCFTAFLMLVIAYFNQFSIYYIIICAICICLAVASIVMSNIYKKY